MAEGGKDAIEFGKNDRGKQAGNQCRVSAESGVARRAPHNIDNVAHSTVSRCIVHDAITISMVMTETAQISVYSTLITYLFSPPPSISSI